MEQMFSDDSRVQIIAQHYGEEPQKNVVQEECAELIQAICKTRRYDDEQTRRHMIEEMSDVFLVLSTLNYYLTSEEKKYLVDNFNTKLDRQISRITKEKCPCDMCNNWNETFERCDDLKDHCIPFKDWVKRTNKEKMLSN